MQKRGQLTGDDRDELFRYIMLLVEAARSAKTMKPFYERKLSDAMWDWTASGYGRDGRWKNDAVKYCTETHACTADASGDGAKRELRHEHVVPRAALVQRMIECHDGGEHAIRKLLDTYGKAAIVTADEHRSFDSKGLKYRMPAENWWEQDVYARYDAAGVSLRK